MEKIELPLSYLGLESLRVEFHPDGFQNRSTWDKSLAKENWETTFQDRTGLRNTSSEGFRTRWSGCDEKILESGYGGIEGNHLHLGDPFLEAKCRRYEMMFFREGAGCGVRVTSFKIGCRGMLEVISW